MSNVNCVSLCNTNAQQQRHRTTPSQVQFLENYFTTVDDFPDSNMREKISSKLNMPSKSVHIWFQNRRAKRKQEERTRQEQEVIRSTSHSSVRASDFHHGSKPNEHNNNNISRTPTKHVNWQNYHHQNEATATTPPNHQRSLQSLTSVFCKPPPSTITTTFPSSLSLSNNVPLHKLSPLRNVNSDDQVSYGKQAEGSITLPSLHHIVPQIFFGTNEDHLPTNGFYSNFGINGNLHVNNTTKPITQNLLPRHQPHQPHHHHHHHHHHPHYPNIPPPPSIRSSSSLRSHHHKSHHYHHCSSLHCQNFMQSLICSSSLCKTTSSHANKSAMNNNNNNNNIDDNNLGENIMKFGFLKICEEISKNNNKENSKEKEESERTFDNTISKFNSLRSHHHKSHHYHHCSSLHCQNFMQSLICSSSLCKTTSSHANKSAMNNNNNNNNIDDNNLGENIMKFGFLKICEEISKNNNKENSKEKEESGIDMKIDNLVN
ncbi:hypothetical protein Glove_174g144 [Diversispora epigaea]|uniref:Homeobox domain-containing protein n=1 Tax=Diversispora epigaea TaxID=1348612 RepID=A0A397IXJ4_9GLOM|nr:hypothetical protein Glove_174g144 [Diversispora epigaea]